MCHKTGVFSCVDKGGQGKTLTPGKDYSIGSFGKLTLSGPVYDARQSDLFSASMETLTDQFILVDSSVYSASAEETMFYKGSIATVMVGLGQEKQVGKISLNDLGNVVWDTIRKNSY